MWVAVGVLAVGVALAFAIVVPRLGGGDVPAPLGHPELDLGVPVLRWSTNDLGRDLHVHTFMPETPAHGVVLFLHGARGNPGQYEEQAEEVAVAGWIGAPVEYTTFAEGASSEDMATEARQLLRWVRGQTVDLGIRPDRVVLVGASAGGRMALATLEIPPDAPDALVLLNPAAGADRLTTDGARPRALVLHAADDRQVPIATAAELCDAYGPTCSFTEYPDGGHGFFQREPHRASTIAQLLDLLATLEESP